MTLGDFLLFLGTFILVFFAGRISMMRSIVKAVMEESENERDSDGQPISNELTIEKINNIYYAYVGPDFAGQAKTFDELMTNMKNHYKFDSFKLSELKNLSSEERIQLLEAIHKNFNQR